MTRTPANEQWETKVRAVDSSLHAVLAAYQRPKAKQPPVWKRGAHKVAGLIQAKQAKPAPAPNIAS